MEPFIVSGKYTTAKVFADPSLVEASCLAQILKMCNHPAFTNPIAIMPDTHSGKGSVIGFTMPLGDKLVPNVVGMDVGCGMLCIPVISPCSLQDISERQRLLHKIKAAVPLGTNLHSRSGEFDIRKLFPWEATTQKLLNVLRKNYEEKLGHPFASLGHYSLEWMAKSNQGRWRVRDGTVAQSLGTLGGGRVIASRPFPSSVKILY